MISEAVENNLGSYFSSDVCGFLITYEFNFFDSTFMSLSSFIYFFNFFFYVAALIVCSVALEYISSE